jgi:succinoglycan biosynthesis protein ExoM
MGNGVWIAAFTGCAAVFDLSEAGMTMPVALAPDEPRIIDVCVCTFRRPSVAETLASLGSQVLPDGWRMRVIVADNDDTPSARDTVAGSFAANGLDGRYIHAPARNISIARNACLDAAEAPLVAFIDDDESAHPDWLATMAMHIEDEGVDIVFGRVEAMYAPDAPDWMVDGDLHSTRAVLRDGVVDGGYTCNVLFRMARIGAQRFDPALGRSGGEDTTFFSELYLAGASAAYAPDAVVYEPVPESRSSLGWLAKRSFRSGQTWAAVALHKGGKRPVLAASAALKMTYCAGEAAVGVFSAAAWRKAVVRGALHAGVLGAALGKRPLQLY